MSKKQKREIRNLKLENKNLREDNIHYSFKICALEGQIYEVIREEEELQEEIKKLKNRGLWARIWNK